jgi:hypothetical protein
MSCDFLEPVEECLDICGIQVLNKLLCDDVELEVGAASRELETTKGNYILTFL